MRRLQCKDIDDPLHKFIIIFAQKLSDNFIVVLQDLIETVMHGIFLQLDSVVENDVDPVLANIELRYFIAFDYLPNEIVGLVEDCFESVVLLL